MLPYSNYHLFNNLLQKKENQPLLLVLFSKDLQKKNKAHFIEPSQRSELKHWRDFYESPKPGVGSQESEVSPIHHSLLTINDSPLIQLHNEYILSQTANGFILINQQAAHERIIYERLQEAAKGKAVATQRSMFPVTIELTPADTVLLEDLMNDLQQLGYMIEPFGKNTFVIQGTPADVTQGNEKQVIDSLLEQYKHFSNEMKFSKREKLIRSAAWQQSIKPGKKLTEKEMQSLVEDLFACQQPAMAPNGNPVYLEFKKEQLEKMFGK